MPWEKTEEWFQWNWLQVKLEEEKNITCRLGCVVWVAFCSSSNIRSKWRKVDRKLNALERNATINSHQDFEAGRKMQQIPKVLLKLLTVSLNQSPMATTVSCSPLNVVSLLNLSKTWASFSHAVYPYIVQEHCVIKAIGWKTYFLPRYGPM